MSTQEIEHDWWQAFYEDTPFELFLERKDPTEVDRTLDFLIDKLGVKPGSAVFDQCCGMGSVATPFAQRGYRLTGVDLCSKYIDAAQNASRLHSLDSQFFCDDAFTFKVSHQCDAAFNWWTSFGYASNDKRNATMLLRAIESIKTGARFALDYPNVPFVLRNFAPREVKEYRTEQGTVRIVRDTVIDLDRGTRSQRWTFVLADGKEVVQDTTLRLYLPHSIKELMESVGFAGVVFFGDVDGSPITVDSPRCIALATKA